MSLLLKQRGNSKVEILGYVLMDACFVAIIAGAMIVCYNSLLPSLA